MRAELGRAALNYEIDGPEDGPVVMFSHSLAADLTMFDVQAPVFRDAGYRVLRYDMRGHGKSDPPAAPLSLELLADDAVALMDHLSIERVHWVGLSMGGMIGQVLGADHGDRVASLTLASTTSAIPPEMASVWDERIAAARTHGMAHVAEATLPRWFTEAARDPEIPEIAAVRRMIADTSVEGYCACCEALKRWRFTDRLDAIAAPAFVVQGRDDPSTTVAAGEVIADAVPGARLAVIENASHFANVERAERWTAAVKDWVDAQR